MSALPVVELFGPTVQGEGAMIGAKTMFLRLAGCDYKCKWCDTKYAWDRKNPEILVLEPWQIVAELTKLNGDKTPKVVTITGGNPAIHNLRALVNELHDEDIKVVVETQGSIDQWWFDGVDHLILSPKPPSSGMKTDFLMLNQIVQKALKREQHMSMKVVVFNDEDYEYAQYLHKYFSDVPFFLQVGNHAVGSNELPTLRENLLLKLNWLVQKVLVDETMNDVRVLPQLHTLIWGNERGV